MDTDGRYHRFSTSPPPPEHDNLRDKRIEFALFMTILIRCLEKSHQSSILRQARLVVLACIRSHKTGDINFDPLDEAIVHHLKKVVDEETWSQARRYTKFYLARKLRCPASYYSPATFVQFCIPTTRSSCTQLDATRIEQI
jgi:hypothetical protein